MTLGSVAFCVTMALVDRAVFPVQFSAQRVIDLAAAREQEAFRNRGTAPNPTRERTLAGTSFPALDPLFSVEEGEKMNCKVEATVIKILEGGECSFGHKVGDKWVFAGKMPAGLCGTAAHSLFPLVQTLRFGATPSSSKEDGVARRCCTDPDNPVVFELRRLDEPIG